MAVLGELLTYLAGQGVGTAATDLFATLMPASPDTLVCLYDYGGTAGLSTHDQAAPAYEQPRIQVVARGPREDYQTAQTKAALAYTVLAAVVNQTLSGVRYLKITPLQTPFEMRRDHLERVHVGFNVEILKEPS